MDISSIPLAVDQLYWSRPNPEIMRAFNMATYALTNRRLPTLAIVSSSLYAVEIMKRSSNSLALAGTGTFDPKLFTEIMVPWAWGDVHPVELASERERYATILWAHPLKESVEAVLNRLRFLAERSCDLEVFVASGIRWGLPRLAGNRKSNAAKTRDMPLYPAEIINLLKLYEWQVDTLIPYNGPRAELWRGLAGIFNRLNWLLWSDRCSQMMRSQLREPGWLWRLAPMVLIRARRG